MLALIPLLILAGPVDRPSDPPEEALWEQIAALGNEPAATQPYAAWFDNVIRQREARLSQLQLYQTLYPGGAHRLEVAKLELQTLFDLGSLRGGAYGPLCDRVRKYLRIDRPDDPVQWEAAYWEILCHRLAWGGSASQPT